MCAGCTLRILLLLEVGIYPFLSILVHFISTELLDMIVQRIFKMPSLWLLPSLYVDMTCVERSALSF